MSKQDRVNTGWYGHRQSIALYDDRFQKPEGNISILHPTLKLKHILNNRVISNVLIQTHLFYLKLAFSPYLPIEKKWGGGSLWSLYENTRKHSLYFAL